MLRQGFDEAMNRCAARGLFDFRLIGTFPAIADIIADGVVEQNGILRNDADGTAQAALGHVAYILPINGDMTAGNIVKAIKQTRDGGLARARWANHGQRMAGLYVEADAV